MTGFYFGPIQPWTVESSNIRQGCAWEAQDDSFGNNSDTEIPSPESGMDLLLFSRGRHLSSQTWPALTSELPGCTSKPKGWHGKRPAVGVHGTPWLSTLKPADGFLFRDLLGFQVKSLWGLMPLFDMSGVSNWGSSSRTWYLRRIPGGETASRRRLHLCEGGGTPFLRKEGRGSEAEGGPHTLDPKPPLDFLPAQDHGLPVS